MDYILLEDYESTKNTKLYTCSMTKVNKMLCQNYMAFLYTVISYQLLTMTI